MTSHSGSGSGIIRPSVPSVPLPERDDNAGNTVDSAATDLRRKYAIEFENWKHMDAKKRARSGDEAVLQLEGSCPGTLAQRECENLTRLVEKVMTKAKEVHASKDIPNDQTFRLIQGVAEQVCLVLQQLRVERRDDLQGGMQKVHRPNQPLMTIVGKDVYEEMMKALADFE